MGLILHVQHDTLYRHEHAVEHAQHLAFLLPRDTPTQRVLDWQLDIEPRPDGWATASTSNLDTAPGLSRDAFGNLRLHLSHSRVHHRLLVCARSRVQRLVPPTPNSAVAAPPAWEAVAEHLRYRPAGQHPAAPEVVGFRLASAFTQGSAALHALARSCFAPGLSVAQGAQLLMHRLHSELRYRPHSTQVSTPAAAAWAQREGVCQDFAHILVAACRSLGLAARYVSGYLLTEPPPGQPRLLGADASHAWAEVWCPVAGWLGLDPTNGIAAGDGHVVLAWGRDYADVAPLRGVIRGGTQAPPQVAVTVTATGPATVTD